MINLGKLCGHDELNWTIVAGDFSESDENLDTLLRIIENEYKEIEKDGLDVTIENVKPGDFYGCTGPGVYKFFFGDVGCGDLAWLVKAVGQKSCSSRFVHLTHKLDLHAVLSIANRAPDQTNTISYDQRMTWYESCESEANRAETDLLRAAADQAQVTPTLVGGIHMSPSASAAAVASARDKAKKDKANAEGHSQYGNKPLYLWRACMYCGLHLRMLMVQLVVESLVVYGIMYDEIDSKSTSYPVEGYIAHLMLALVTMGLKCIADRIANKWSDDERKRKYESSYRLTGYAATRVQNKFYLMMDVFGTPVLPLNISSASASHIYVAAEGLVIGYVNAMTPLMLSSTITIEQADRLIELGEQLYALIVLFGIGPKRKRHVGLKESVLCRFMPWNLKMMIKRFTYFDVKGEPQGVSMGGHVFGQDAAERRNKNVKKGILGNTNRHFDKWRQLLSWEDVRIFGGWRTSPRDVPSWLQRDTAHILKEKVHSDCTFCGRPDCSTSSDLTLSQQEVQMGFSARTCSWCMLMLIIKRTCIDTRELTGIIREILHARTAGTLAEMQDVDAPLGPDPRTSADADAVTRDDAAECETSEEGQLRQFDEFSNTTQLAQAIAQREDVAKALSNEVPNSTSEETPPAAPRATAAPSATAARARPRPRPVPSALRRSGI